MTMKRFVQRVDPCTTGRPAYHPAAPRKSVQVLHCYIHAAIERVGTLRDTRVDPDG